MAETNAATSLEAAVARSAEIALDRVAAARAAVATVIFGQEKVVEEVLVTLLAGGHGLLVGVPGLAKTKLVDTLGTVLGLDARRVQFTPDLMPADILGSEILEESIDHKRSFKFMKGPIFAQLLMADEINRASPRTQSALLQAMQEYHVSVAGERYDLPAPFHVLATQNPLEQEGTYPLPEAQLDRFLMQIDVDYPDRAAERRILIETTGDSQAKAKAAMTAEDLQATQRLVRRLPVGEAIVEAILDIVRSARPGEGSDAASGTGADARLPRPCARVRPPVAVDGRRCDVGPAGAEAPHGAHLQRPRRGRDHRGHRRQAGAEVQVTVVIPEAAKRSSGTGEPRAHRMSRGAPVPGSPAAPRNDEFSYRQGLPGSMSRLTICPARTKSP